MSALESSISDSREWFALYVRTKWERNVAHHLNDKGFETYVPCLLVRRKWQDRTKSIEVPLFSNYVFCRFDPRHRFPIITTPEVHSIVGIGKNPTPIPDEEIRAIQRVIKNGQSVESVERMIVPGERVVVVSGPLTGLRGIVLRVKNTWHLVVSITLLQRGVKTEILRDAIESLENRGPRSETA